MDKRIEQAIKDFNQAQKENTKAQQAYKAATEEQNRIIEQAYKNGFKAVTTEDNNRIEQSEVAVRKAKKAATIATAVYQAASQNVSNIASEVLKEAVLSNPEQFNLPVHYKKFKAAFNAVLPEQHFYYSDSDYSFYVYFKKGMYNHCQSFAFDKKNEYINTERTTLKESILTLKDIKTEATAAYKYSEKLKAAYEKLKSEADTARNSFKSDIKYSVPYISYNGLTNTELFN